MKTMVRVCFSCTPTTGKWHEKHVWSDDLYVWKDTFSNSDGHPCAVVYSEDGIVSDHYLNEIKVETP